MASLTTLLKQHKLVALDTCVWIYHFSAHPQFAKPASQLLTAIANGRCRAVMSELVLLELLTGPLKLGQQDVADDYETLLTHFPNLTCAPVSRDVLLAAAQLRALHGFRTPDAIMLATAREHGATLMVTNDKSWSKYPELAVACLSEFA